MPAPLISIVVPCYNATRTLAETIASASAQTLTDFEIIAVDDGSTDGTGDLLEQLARGEPRLVIIAQPNKGLAGARNSAIRQAHGRFIALLDADDLWDADYLEAHLANLADASVGVSFSRLRYIDMAGAPTGSETRPKLSGLTPADFLRSNPCTSLIVVRREVFAGAGLFNETLRRVEDQEWLFRAAAGGWTMRGIDRVLASYRITPGSLSSNVEAMLASFEAFLDHAATIAPEVVARHRRLALAGMLRYCARRALAHDKESAIARRTMLRAIWTAPDLLVREPVTTFATLVAALVPGAGRLIFSRSLRPKSAAATGAA